MRLRREHHCFTSEMLYQLSYVGTAWTASSEYGPAFAGPPAGSPGPLVRERRILLEPDDAHPELVLDDLMAVVAELRHPFAGKRSDRQ
jgi:hypothetical protein